jgi:P-type Ca2+ transporter type 2C
LCGCRYSINTSKSHLFFQSGRLFATLTFYSARRLDNGFNIFQGIHKNYWFIGIQFIIMGGQALIVNVGDAAFSVFMLNGAQWGYSIVLGILSIPVAIFIRLIPDELIANLLSFLPRRRSSNPSFMFEDDERVQEWNPALEEIREELSFLKRVRGGRMSELAYKLQHPAQTLIPRSRSGSHSRSDLSLGQSAEVEDGAAELGSVPPATPDKGRKRGRSRSNSRFGPAAAMAGIIAGSVAGGWSPVERGQGETDNVVFSSSKVHGGLGSTEGIEVHPDTKQDDPVIVENPQRSRVPPSQNPALTPNFDHASDKDTSSKDQQDGRSTSQHKSPKSDSKN